MGDVPPSLEICHRPPLSGNAAHRLGDFLIHWRNRRASARPTRSLRQALQKKFAGTVRAFLLSIRWAPALPPRSKDSTFAGRFDERPAVSHQARRMRGIQIRGSAPEAEACHPRLLVSRRSLPDRERPRSCHRATTPEQGYTLRPSSTVQAFRDEGHRSKFRH